MARLLHSIDGLSRSVISGGLGAAVVCASIMGAFVFVIFCLPLRRILAQRMTDISPKRFGISRFVREVDFVHRAIGRLQQRFTYLMNMKKEHF